VIDAPESGRREGDMNMNTKIKIAVGVAAGVLAGTTLMGTAFAAPRILTGTAGSGSGSGMMRSIDTSSTFVRPSIADMNAFMNQYRDAAGKIDVTRMHADVAAGKVKPPCTTATGQGAGASAQRQRGRTGTGYGMMGSGASGTTGAGASATTPGYGMMGSTY
jgi:hypothetical protein